MTLEGWENRRSVVTDWMDQAACKGMDPGFFYPPKVEIGNGMRHPAFKVCKACPVREDCLEAAITNHELGIWGGTSERQRRKMRKRRALVVEERRAS